jgi:hypothetical protein
MGIGPGQRRRSPTATNVAPSRIAMDAQLAGLVTLVSYGNLYLARLADAAIEQEFRAELNGAFRFVERMQFGDRPADSPPMAVGLWLGRLLDRKASRLWLTGYARTGGPPARVAASRSRQSSNTSVTDSSWRGTGALPPIGDA